jgi:cellulose synthase operon protein YhjQ
MEKRGTDKTDDLGVAETPEDVAVLYSWANLHGAKYRDFSASRREYRAQLRHRAAEQVRQQALLAQAEAEAAAEAAEATAKKAAEAALHKGSTSDSTQQQSLRQAEEAARTAAAERVEAARRAEAAAVAEAAARREEREIAEAQASAQRQAARYAESEIRRREMTVSGRIAATPQGTGRLFSAETSSDASMEVPGHMEDPYTPQPLSPVSAGAPQASHTGAEPRQPSFRQPQGFPGQQPFSAESHPPAQPAVRSNAQSTAPPAQYPAAQVVESLVARSDSSGSQRRPQGYHPDEASGVRQIYRGPEYTGSQSSPRVTDSGRQSVRAEAMPRERRGTPEQAAQPPQGIPPAPNTATAAGMSSSGDRAPFTEIAKRSTDPKQAPRPSHPAEPQPSAAPFWQSSSAADRSTNFRAGYVSGREPIPGSLSSGYSSQLLPVSSQPPSNPPSRPVSPFSQPPAQPGARQEGVRGRRAQDEFNYQSGGGYSDPSGQSYRTGGTPLIDSEASRPAYSADPAGPAWLYAPPSPTVPQSAPIAPPAQSSVAETLQHSRERVAARWYALKGVFEQPGQEVTEAAPVRQKEIRTPVVAVFSLAGGVGKTSLVATIGRSLSSLGEKVLLTDTTSHGLLPFYFGASELRQGTVRTFSPPSGSTDAPIYLVSYDVDPKAEDQAQQTLVEEIVNNSRGTHRILLDLTVGSSWIVRHMARMNPTVLIPVAPDMNSVISLQAIENFFRGMVDADGRSLQPYYVINQFDVSLPLHLDVREVLRRQLGDRLLPFVIHRAPEVSEALAEGMTVVDYAPDSPVSGDYLNVATWLRTIAAPAAAGFRNVRWSER